MNTGTAIQDRPGPVFSLPQSLICKRDALGQSLLLWRMNASPSIKPNTPPVMEPASSHPLLSLPLKIGDYLLLESVESKISPGITQFKAVELNTQAECLCKAIPISRYRDMLLPYSVTSPHKNVVAVESVVVGASHAYLFFALNHGDLHSYLRSKVRLAEREASLLFHQLVSGVKHCHDQGIVLHDIKLRKCVFTNKAKTNIQLTGLEDSVVLNSPADDKMTDRHGCPAYVSPEIIHCSAMFASEQHRDAVCSYSGRAADIWSLGVILYVMLTGRYPFMDIEPVALFARIATGLFAIPTGLSDLAQHLLYGILERSPDDRLTAVDILGHPWFKYAESAESAIHADPDVLTGATTSCDGPGFGMDQCVPELMDVCAEVWGD